MSENPTEDLFEYYKEHKGEFIKLWAHDVLGPLASVRGHAELLLAGEAGSLNEKQKQFLQRIIRNEESARRMVMSLRDLAPIMWEKLHFPIEKISLSDTLNYTILINKPAIENKKQDFLLQTINCPNVKANTITVQDITSRLLDNANKYTSLGGKITLGTEILGNFVKVFISDTGIGIPIEEQANIFKLFIRSGSPQVRAIPGTGTSLFLCKHYVEYFGGQIGFESEPGEGNTFWFTLPVVRDEDDLDQSPSSPPD